MKAAAQCRQVCLKPSKGRQQAGNEEEDLTKPLKGSGSPLSLSILGVLTPYRLLKASGFGNNYSNVV